jgi:hypothetical protein
MNLVYLNYLFNLLTSNPPQLLNCSSDSGDSYAHMFVTTSSIHWYYFLSIGTVQCTVYLFVCIACFRSLSLGPNDFENLQKLDLQDCE